MPRLLPFCLFLLLLSSPPPPPPAAAAATDFLLNGFDPASLTLYGDATVEPAHRSLSLTNPSNLSIGRALYKSKVATRAPADPSSSSSSSNARRALPFHASFLFSIAPIRGILPGHGIAFLFSPSPGIQGATASQHMGLFNRSTDGDRANRVLAVEFDVFQNQEFSDIDANHVGVDLYSLTSVAAYPAGYWPDGTSSSSSFVDLKLNDGSNYQAWVDYADGRLNVTMAPAALGKKPSRALISKDLDLSDVFLDEMYVGFCAATGMLVERHRILGWSFSNYNSSLSHGLDTSNLPNFVPPEEGRNLGKGVVAGISAAAVAVFMITLASLLVFWRQSRRKKREETGGPGGDGGEEALEDWELEYWPHRIAYRDISAATDAFSDGNLIGCGGNGRVYRGVLGGAQVAVKLFSRNTGEEARQFLAEVSSLGRLKHRNLVGLRGWCRKKEGGDLILVYDYMENGSLDKWLFSADDGAEPLDWETRIDVDPYVDDPGKCSLILSGYVRNHKLSVNQLVHVSGAGDFQLSKVEVLKDPFPISERRNCDSMDSDDSHVGQNLQVIRTLLPDPMKAEPLLVENVPDPLAGEQTWPTEAEMAEANATSKDRKLKKTVPRGTSDYQAAWIIGDMDDDDSESSEDGGDGMVLDQEKNEGLEHEACGQSDLDEEHIDMKDSEDQTETDMMMADDENWTMDQIKAEILKVKEQHAEDEEFPDEVDTPINVPARKRFAKYRGLKSFRTSSWDPKESLPQEYARIFAFDNFRRTQKYALAKVLEIDQGNLDESASIGSYVRLHIKKVPKDVVSQLCNRSERLPVVASGILQHESKMSVLHFSIRKYESYDAPIKSKESLIFHVGFRQFIARPIFSSDNMNCDKHKMEKFLHPGRFSVASVYAPISFPPLPLIVLKSREGMEPVIAAFGSLRSVDPDRIILKKIILSGYPQRVSKSKASVRFMFHNPDDVRWFKPVELWSKCGRRGRVKEPVGTHGAMKCLFNGVVQQHDTVCMSLYKRVYPKWPEKQFPIWDSCQ